jgi:alanine or glycine:cation symporter, AGCS family
MDLLGAFGGYLWSPFTLYALLAAGIIFTVGTKFSQWFALTHGTAVLTGKYDDPDHPGAISHFQALSAALSGTVGLGNIGGVALAISVGGPGALFWMWVTGFLGMAIKSIEVTLALMYRNEEDPRKPSGGAMWVVQKATADKGPVISFLGRMMGGIFCLTLLVSTITGGNIFQSWNVAEMLQANFGIGQLYTSGAMAILVGLVVIGGIERIGVAAGIMVPVMCVLYFGASVAVIGVNIARVPEVLSLVVTSAFSPNAAAGAFLGAGAWYGFEIGMKRALFSNEAGQGSAPIAHSAARTDHPAREGVVAGLEPFIDTLIICTMTALVILLTGTWDRLPLADLPDEVQVTAEATNDGAIITLAPNISADAIAPPSANQAWRAGDRIFVVIDTHQGASSDRGNSLERLIGRVESTPAPDGTQGGNALQVVWESFEIGPDAPMPTLRDRGFYRDLDGAPMTGIAFDSVFPGLGKWLVSLAAFLFALSTMISWCYYGEQGVVYLVGPSMVTLYKLVFIVFAAIAPIAAYNAKALEVITDLGTGLMLWGNLPILFVFGFAAVANFNQYVTDTRSGKLLPPAAMKAASTESKE